MWHSDFITIIILTHEVLFYRDFELESIVYAINEDNISVYISLLDANIVNTWQVFNFYNLSHNTFKVGNVTKFALR